MKLVHIALVILCLFKFTLVAGQSNTFSTIHNGNWDTDSIWLNNSKPVDNTLQQAIHIYDTVVLGSFTMRNQNTITVHEGALLIIDGTLTMDGNNRYLYVEGHVILNGTVNLGSQPNLQINNKGLLTVNSSLPASGVDNTGGIIEFKNSSASYGNVTDPLHLSMLEDQFSLLGSSSVYSGKVRVVRSYDSIAKINNNGINFDFTILQVNNTQDSFYFDAGNFGTISSFIIERSSFTRLAIENSLKIADSFLIASDILLYTCTTIDTFYTGSSSVMIVDENVTAGIHITNSQIYSSGDFEVSGTLEIIGSLDQIEGVITNGNHINSSNNSKIKKLKIRGNGNSKSPILMHGNFIVEEELEFVNDAQIITGNHVLVIQNPSPGAIKGIGPNRYVQGNLKRAVNSTGEYSFPVGDSNGKREAIIEIIQSSGISEITIGYDEQVVDRFPLNIPTEGPYDSVIAIGKWNVEPDNYGGSINYNIKIDISDIPGLTDNRFGILKRPLASTSSYDWNVVGELPDWGLTGRTVSSGYAIRYDLNSFSEFGIGVSGEDINSGLLSVTYEFITGEVKNLDALIKWATATEYNVSGYEIERSVNLGEWQPVQYVPASMNTQKMTEYVVVDQNVFERHRTAYYRIRQLGLGGDEEYSAIIRVETEVNHPDPEIHPNLISEVIRVNFPEAFVEEFLITITDIAGNVVFRENLTPENNQMILPAENLKPGIYLVFIENEKRNFSRKIIKQ